MKLIFCFTRIFFSMMVFTIFLSCNKENENEIPDVNIDTPVFYSFNKFCMGADLSYVNQVLDHGGIYKDSGISEEPFRIFKEHGANIIRIRLWNNPLWTKEVYGASGTQLYSDIKDVEKSIAKAKENGMAVNLDFHFSDIWADPANQNVPEAWKNIQDTTILKDSVYNFTFGILDKLNKKGLMPEMVQIGNEINCGMFFTNPEQGFPELNCCNGNWKELGAIINAGIKAVRDVSELSAIKTKVILHIADPKNVEWWFDNIIDQAKVTDFDIVGFSYYPIWHKTVGIDQIGNQISAFKTRYNRKVMILEVAYPWTYASNDSYTNAFGNQSPAGAYLFTKDGQYRFMVELTQNVIGAGGDGVFYWEPAWISSEMKDLWGTGSSWENATFFDFEGNVLKSIDFMTFKYSFAVK